MSYYKEKITPTEKYLHKRAKQLEYELIYWGHLSHFKHSIKARALVVIKKETKIVQKFLKNFK
jgi:hypothetical protein